ncbi:hypothetical protein FVA80_05030 [Methylobacterium sp. WL1]|nr:hypothetical protein FVA80_05030 [Methylobacterium sp. WL1]
MFDLSHPPHPEAPERSGGLEGALQPAARSLEGSFEAAAPYLRMRGECGISANRNRHATGTGRTNRLSGSRIVAERRRVRRSGP